MNILVTGGAGYIGSVLTEKLLEIGHKVTIVDNFRHGFHGILHLVTHPNLEIINRNILDPNRDYLIDKDFIFHLASLTSVKDCDENKIEAFKINATILDGLAYDACKTPILYTSTTAVYGDRGGELVDENSNVMSTATSVYSSSKLSGEQYLKKYDNIIILRLATIYGVSPLMRSHSIVNDFVRWAVRYKSIIIYDDKTMRPYMNILNCVDGLIYVMDNKNKFIGRIYNLIGHNAYKYEIARAIYKHIKFDYFKSEYSDPYKQDFRIDSGNFSRLGCKFIYSKYAAIRDLIKLYSFHD